MSPSQPALYTAVPRKHGTVVGCVYPAAASLVAICSLQRFYSNLGFSPGFGFRVLSISPSTAYKLASSSAPFWAVFVEVFCLAWFYDQAVHNWNKSLKTLDLNPPLSGSISYKRSLHFLV